MSSVNKNEERQPAEEGRSGRVEKTLKATFLNVERTFYIHQNKVVFKVLTSGGESIKSAISYNFT